MFYSDVYIDAPTGGDLLTEIGIDPHTVREVIQEDRAMRCPERPCVPRDGDTPSQRAWHEAEVIVIPGAIKYREHAQLPADAVRVGGKREKDERKGDGERDRPGLTDVRQPIVINRT